MTKLNFRGYIKNGRLALNSELQYKKAISGFKEGAKVVLSIVLQKEFRTISQHNYYWVYMTVIGEETGNNPNDLHEMHFKPKYFPKVEKEVMGEIKERPAHIYELTKGELNAIIAEIVLETNIPSPNPVLVGYSPN